jgi:DNA-binding NtrC family response regulator
MANALRDSVWDPDEEEIARPSCSILLITAMASEQVEALARRIHRRGIGRAKKPFLVISAADLPADREALRTACQVWGRAASGGTILFADVEEMPPAVQHQFAELMEGPQGPLNSSAGVRIIAGTTASLVDLVATGRFSDTLFYRLNIIHIVVETCSRVATDDVSLRS